MGPKAFHVTTIKVHSLTWQETITQLWRTALRLKRLNQFSTHWLLCYATSVHCVPVSSCFFLTCFGEFKRFRLVTPKPFPVTFATRWLRVAAMPCVLGIKKWSAGLKRMAENLRRVSCGSTCHYLIVRLKNIQPGSRVTFIGSFKSLPADGVVGQKPQCEPGARTDDGRRQLESR